MPDLQKFDKTKLNERMADLDRERSIVKNQLDRDRLTQITSSLIETITSPAFVERMRDFRSQAAKGASFKEAGDLMSLENLKSAGAVVPDDFRLTSRVFEDREAGIRFELKPPGIEDLLRDRGGLVGWGACAGGGAATVCGCAGGGS